MYIPRPAVSEDHRHTGSSERAFEKGPMARRQSGHGAPRRHAQVRMRESWGLLGDVSRPMIEPPVLETAALPTG